MEIAPGDGYLVTSIINLSHKPARGLNEEQIITSTGEFRMPMYSEIMTVEQLIDLVAFFTIALQRCSHTSIILVKFDARKSLR